MDKLLAQLRRDYLDLTFRAEKSFYWSPDQSQIAYRSDSQEPIGSWSLLHELGHALLDHRSYQTDLELLLMEVAAWDQAVRVAPDYKISIDNEHVQDCLDTYRDWLDQRSTCPLCGNTGLQHSIREYSCFNCQTSWQVSASRFCRPYRQINRGKTKTPPVGTPRAVFR